MDDPVPLDREWLRMHPLPQVAHDTDKNARGRVLVVGGSRRSPGALLLAGLAAFRAGAGKVQLATFAEAALPLGVALPEAGVVALAETAAGGLAPNDELNGLMAHCDTVVLGPGMSDDASAAALLDRALDVLEAPQTLVIDAAAIAPAGARAAALSKRGIQCVLSPHAGEMARLLGCDRAEVEADPRSALARAVEATAQVVLIKGATTYIAAPAGTQLAFAGGGPGLATGGSGDVLAGVIGALLARDLGPLAAAAWGTWLHGEAGRRLAETIGPVGFVARELVPEIPSLMRGFA